MAAEGTLVNPIAGPSPASPAPPGWAQTMLSALLPRASDESVSGDLLEQYRETVFPARGALGANVWYVRQAAGFLWRSTWIFVVFFASILILRTIVDTFAPPGLAPHSYQFRSALSGRSAIGTFLVAGLFAGYRTGRSSAGLLTALVTSAAGYAIAVCFDIVLFLTVIQHDAEKLSLFYITGGWGEELGLPIIHTFIAAMLGLLGGTCGEYLSRIRRRPWAA